MKWLIIGGVLVFGIILFAPQLRLLMRYLSGLFVKNIAETPEGAEAVYDEMIAKAQLEYNIAADTLQNISGQLRSERETRKSLEDSLQKIEKECERLVDEGRLEDARTASGQRYDLMSRLDLCRESLEKLAATEQDAREMHRIFENNLLRLKQEKQLKIQEIIVNSHLTKAYTSLDKLRKSSGADRMLDAVEESARHKAAMAAGAKAVYEMQAPLSEAAPDHVARQLESENFVNSLLAKQESMKKATGSRDDLDRKNN